MGFKSDIEIAQECTMEPITKIAEKAGTELRTDYPCSELMKTVRHNRNIGIKVVVLNNFH